MKRNSYSLLLLPITVLVLGGCSKVLDKQNLNQISGSIVWTDQNLINAYVNQIYKEFQTQVDWYWNDDNDSYADDAGWGNAITHGQDVAYGRITPDNDPLDYWPYATIRKMNDFFGNIDASPLDPALITSLKGQVYFLRAFEYFEMVKRYGGVPIITKVQSLSDSLFVKRNKTSECFAFILKDLDSASALLPDTYGSNDAGRITHSAALAFKGRVLLYKASPQFNPSGNQSLWTDAYNANNAAIAYLQAQGYGLYTTGADAYGGLWFDELNKEDILVTRHHNPENPDQHDAGVRPLSESYNWAGMSQPTQEMVEAFPMANGLAITDPNSGYNFNNYWVGRDPRFYSTVVYNGAPYPLSGKTGRIQWTYKGTLENGGPGDGYLADYGTSTGYYCRKGIDVSITQALAWNAGTDWVEMRYAEVMLNFVETANETGQIQAAYNMLTAIRARAGITPGSGSLYGLKAGMTQSEMRAAIIAERRVELCFENKRFWDLRRWRLLGTLNGTRRHALESDINVPGNLASGFTLTVQPEDVLQTLTLPDSYYFLPILRTELRNNPNLVQTKGWEDGTFDPLQ
ncbi:MAG TPA: RagB/SusD family nutrient uptake outer membrane protein [Puia sp.]